MSEAKKCDRCGKFYEENELMESKCSVLGSTIGGINTATKDGRKDEHFDLCDDCVKSLFIWKNHPEFEDRGFLLTLDIQTMPEMCLLQ